MDWLLSVDELSSEIAHLTAERDELEKSVQAQRNLVAYWQGMETRIAIERDAAIARAERAERVASAIGGDVSMVAYALLLQGNALISRASEGYRKGSLVPIEDADKCWADGNRLLEIRRALVEACEGGGQDVD